MLSPLGRRSRSRRGRPVEQQPTAATAGHPGANAQSAVLRTTARGPAAAGLVTHEWLRKNESDAAIESIAGADLHHPSHLRDPRKCSAREKISRPRLG